jgi:predicted nucleotidyltransferase
MDSKGIKRDELKLVFDILEEAFKTLGIDFYLIGAIARDQWFAQKDIRARVTKDIDFAVFVSSEDQYQELREYLKDHDYADTRENAFVLISPEGMQIDILPFGAIATIDGVKIAGEGMTTIQVDGFEEVFGAGTAAVTLGTGHVFKAATLSGIVLLKLVAYDDRPEKRLKDAADIAGILQHFFDLHADLIFEEHNDLFDETIDRDLTEIAAIVVGREMKKICGSNTALLKRLQQIVQGEIERGETSDFIRQMVRETESTVENMGNLLTNLAAGLK